MTDCINKEGISALLLHLANICAVAFIPGCDERPHIRIQVNGQFVQIFLIDSGATRSVIELSLLPEGTDIRALESPIKLSTANGSALEVVGITTLSLFMDGKAVKWDFFVVKGLTTSSRAILGWDFLKAKAHIYSDKMVLKRVALDAIETERKEPNMEKTYNGCIQAIENVTIQPKAAMFNLVKLLLGRRDLRMIRSMARK